MIFFIITVAIILPTTVKAATESQLRTQIEANLKKQAELEQQIIEYSKLYSATSAQAQTLQTALKTLELNQKKLQADLSYTGKKIENANITIENLSERIDDTQSAINTNAGALSSSLNSLNSSENDSGVEKFFTYSTLSDAWDDITLLSRYQTDVSNILSDAKDLKDQLLNQKTSKETEKSKLETYKKQLSDQKSIVDSTQKTKDNLLIATRSKESEYKKQLLEKQKQKDAFEKELFDYESQLRILFDPNSIPGERAGILSWPIANPYLTQMFGKTVSAKRLYVSGTHNGIDFRALIGTKVTSALSGTVWGTGDTDIYPNCYSFGRWVMIKHANGLSTIYAHLSKISVKTGDTVVTGDLIGYSGNTGYSTGPHLHLGVYATAGTRVDQFSASKFCKQAVLPIADPKAYLDPMLYLPTYSQ